MEVFHDVYYDKDEEIISGFQTLFPHDITIVQASAAWKHIVQYQNRVEGLHLM